MNAVDRGRECVFFLLLQFIQFGGLLIHFADDFGTQMRVPLPICLFHSFFCSLLSFCNLVKLKWLFDICLYRLILFYFIFFRFFLKQQIYSHLFRLSLCAVFPFPPLSTFFILFIIIIIIIFFFFCCLIYRAFFRFSIIPSFFISFLCVLYCNYYDCYSFFSFSLYIHDYTYTHTHFIQKLSFSISTLYFQHSARVSFLLLLLLLSFISVCIFILYKFAVGVVVRFFFGFCAFYTLSLRYYYYDIILFYLLLCWITEKFVT